VGMRIGLVALTVLVSTQVGDVRRINKVLRLLFCPIGARENRYCTGNRIVARQLQTTCVCLSSADLQGFHSSGYRRWPIVSRRCH